MQYNLNLVGYTPDEIIDVVRAAAPEIDTVLARSRAVIPEIKVKREILEYQAAVLYLVTKKNFSARSARILEIGTALGYSCSIIAQAAPSSQIVTLNPHKTEFPMAVKHLSAFPNVRVVQMTSQDYLRGLRGDERFDMVFVDGDHKNVHLDMPYWDFIADRGLFLHHDFSPPGCWRECVPVWYTLTAFKWHAGEFDIEVIDDRKVGMAGWYK